MFVAAHDTFLTPAELKFQGAWLRLGGNTSFVPLKARDLNLEFGGLNYVGRQHKLTNVRAGVVEAGTQ